MGRRSASPDGWSSIRSESTVRQCTGDRQWIHVDVERAERESPFKGPIGARISDAVVDRIVVAGSRHRSEPMPRQCFNYGLEKVRFLAPVLAGARVRLRVILDSVEDKGRGQLLVKTRNILEIEKLGKARAHRRGAGSHRSRKAADVSRKETT